MRLKNERNKDMSGIIDADLFAATIRIATPILLVAMGGLFSLRAHVFNIALEGLMLIGSFFAIFAIDRTGNTWIGLAGGLIAGILLSVIYALSVIHFNVDAIMASIAVNFLGLGLTTFLIRPIFGTSGGYRPENMQPLPSLDIPLIKDIPFIGPVISGHTPLVYVSFLVVIIVYVMLYKTPFGLAIRSVGDNPDAARTAGISNNRIKWLVVLWSGALCGLAGAHLATGYVSEFTENMTQGRGFTAFSAIVFGAEHPILVFIASLVFGFADAIGFRFQLEGFGLPPSILKIFPYFLAIVALTFSAALRTKRRTGIEV
jgi:simple sugar transport system permease protein